MDSANPGARQPRRAAAAAPPYEKFESVAVQIVKTGLALGAHQLGIVNARPCGACVFSLDGEDVRGFLSNATGTKEAPRNDVRLDRRLAVVAEPTDCPHGTRIH